MKKIITTEERRAIRRERDRKRASLDCLTQIDLLADRLFRQGWRSGNKALSLGAHEIGHVLGLIRRADTATLNDVDVLICRARNASDGFPPPPRPKPPSGPVVDLAAYRALRALQNRSAQ
jgi:hypothetical protein